MADNTLTLDEIHRIIGELYLQTVLLRKMLAQTQEEEKK